ncbi:acyl-CoA thioesterase [Isoalcanivorax beigongshangi]|uniref:Acyl-CoA thioesterase n=1 Tax=Isoalcanivorax beigongshangi TaxID=3238810 RepID=A0ABV4AKX8_9GAMM
MFELISAAMRRKKTPTHGLFDTVSMDFRVGMFDLDINLHLNNAKYLKFMDRCRLEHAVSTGLLNEMIKARCNAVVANTEVAYVRELRPYQQFTVRTRIMGWDDKYVYYDQRFESQGKLHTHAMLRLVNMYGGKAISPQAVQEMTGLNQSSPALPEYVEQWKRLLQTKRRYAESDQELPADF